MGDARHRPGHRPGELRESCAWPGGGVDLVRLYLDEIGQWSLLDREGECRLGKVIQSGREARDRLHRGDHLDTHERRELARMVYDGEEAERRFAEANLRLVVSIAKKYRRPGVEMLDLVQAGNLGLLRAVERFDWRLGNRFSTYATWWIRQAIIREAGQSGRTIRLPEHVREQIVALACARDRLRSELSREPRAEELSEVLATPLDRVQELIAMAESVVSLSSPVGGHDERELANVLAEDATADPAERAAALSE